MSKNKLSHFPWPAAFLCAACVGAAVWTWMEYSYLWKLAPEMPSRGTSGADPWLSRDTLPWYLGRYVRLCGTLEYTWGATDTVPITFGCGLRTGRIERPSGVNERRRGPRDGENSGNLLRRSVV